MYLYKLLGKKEVVNGSFHILSCSRELNLTNLLIEPFIHNRCMLSSHFIAQITKPHDPYVSNFSKQSLLPYIVGNKIKIHFDEASFMI